VTGFIPKGLPILFGSVTGPPIWIPGWKDFRVADDPLTICSRYNSESVKRVNSQEHALTARDLAKLLNVSAVTIFKHAKAGRIPCFKIGSAVRFCPKTISDWLYER